jgi:hypothetical protein
MYPIIGVKPDGKHVHTVGQKSATVAHEKGYAVRHEYLRKVSALDKEIARAFMSRSLRERVLLVGGNMYIQTLGILSLVQAFLLNKQWEALVTGLAAGMARATLESKKYIRRPYEVYE